MKSVLIFPFFYLKEIVAGALRVSRDVLAPRPKLAPVILEVPLGEMSGRQRLVLANLVSMTPGTLSIDESADGRTMRVHSLYGGDDPQAEISNILERYVPVVSRLPI